MTPGDTTCMESISKTTILPGEPMTPKTNMPNTPVLITLILAAVLFVGFVVFLSSNGKDTSDAIQMIVMLVPVLFLQILSAVRIDRIDNQTNGNLTQRLNQTADKINQHTSTVVAPVPTDTGTPGVDPLPLVPQTSRIDPSNSSE